MENSRFSTNMQLHLGNCTGYRHSWRKTLNRKSSCNHGWIKSFVVTVPSQLRDYSQWISKLQMEQEQSETAYEYVRQGEYGLDPESVSGYRLRIRTLEHAITGAWFSTYNASLKGWSAGLRLDPLGGSQHSHRLLNCIGRKGPPDMEGRTKGERKEERQKKK